MPFKPATLVLDSVSGWFDLAISAELGDNPKPMTYTALPYNKLMGMWHRDVRIMREIQRKHHILVGVVGHTKHREDWVTLGYDPKGNPIKDARVRGWQLSVPGKGEDAIRAAFSEIWHLVCANPNTSGINPMRKMHTVDHIWEEWVFKCKTRKNILGPIDNPTWDKMMAKLPPGTDVPEMVLVLGAPGVGKTRFWETAPKPIQFIDLMGGCEESAKHEGIKVITPSTPEEVFQLLRSLRDKGEVA